MILQLLENTSWIIYINKNSLNIAKTFMFYFNQIGFYTYTLIEFVIKFWCLCKRYIFLTLTLSALQDKTNHL